MKIKGKYRDVLSRDGAVIVDTGWHSNVIVVDYGRFLAALMKKDFNDTVGVGIDYMAVGSGSIVYADFKKKVESFFKELNNGNLGPYFPDETCWVWAKKIERGDIKYLNDEDKVVNDVTNRLRIEVTFRKEEEAEEPEPSAKTLEFREFALLGIDKNSGGTFDTDKMFFINYVDHGLITKDKSMVLTRTVILTFPVKEEVVS
jgi:hypothetical protein